MEFEERSLTTGMIIEKRIFHVGGRKNAAGYIEFESIQAVEALVRHVFCDLLAAPPVQEQEQEQEQEPIGQADNLNL